MKNRFYLFACNTHYPNGGAEDFQGSFETADDAMVSHNPKNFKYEGGWANIFDTKTEKIIRKFEDGIWQDTRRISNVINKIG